MTRTIDCTLSEDMLELIAEHGLDAVPELALRDFPG